MQVTSRKGEDLCRLANCYDFGIGVRKNLKNAFELYLKAAKVGDEIAQYNLALMYQNGKPITRNDKLAFKWMKLAARSDAEAMANLGFMYMRGIGTRKNLKKACDLYKKAAKHKVARAHYNLGLMAYSGEGVKQDDRVAVKHFKSAVELKHRASVLELARIYLDESSPLFNKRLGNLYKKRAIQLDLKEAKSL